MYTDLSNKKFHSSDKASPSNEQVAPHSAESPELNFLTNLQTNSTEKTSNQPVNDAQYTEELHNYYDSIIACMPNNVYWLDRNCILMGGNDNLARMFHLKSRTELVGLSYEQMSKLANWTEGQGESFKRTEIEVMTTGIPRLNVEEPPVVINGEIRYYMASKVPLYNLNQEIIGVVGISTDITDQKLLANKLQEAKEKAEAANKAKTQFLENMRHDIRTPLIGITGFASIIRDEVKDKVIQEHIDSLISSSQGLLNLLNEILEGVKVASGEIPLLKKKVDLKKRLYEIIELNKAKAAQKNIELIFNYDENLPCTIISDPMRVHRIILELVSNALNFTEKGYVKLTTQLAKKENRDLVIKIVVEDTGIGIPASKQEEVFVQFNRLTPAHEGVYKGTGLGLSIVKQFLNELDAEIYVVSELNKGTTFTCLIPVKQPLLDDDINYTNKKIIADNNFSYKENEKKSVQANSKNYLNKVLLVEDQAIAALATKNMLINLACDVDIAASGSTALELAEKNNYDLIFMDIGLPDIDGYHATKKIRASMHNSTQNAAIPIIGLTAHLDIEQTKDYVDTGINTIIQKPLSKDKIKEILSIFIPGNDL